MKKILSILAVVICILLLITGFYSLYTKSRELGAIANTASSTIKKISLYLLSVIMSSPHKQVHCVLYNQAKLIQE